MTSWVGNKLQACLEAQIMNMYVYTVYTVYVHVSMYVHCHLNDYVQIEATIS